MRFKRIETADGDTLILRDDGYRISARYIAGLNRNIAREEWILVMEYKRCDYPMIADAVVNVLMDGSSDQERLQLTGREIEAGLLLNDEEGAR